MSESKSESKPENQTPQKIPLAVAVAGVGLLVGGAVAALWFLWKQQPSARLPSGTTLVPNEALMSISLSTDPRQWEKLRQFGTPESQAWFDEQLLTLRDRLLSDNGYNYQEDIEPWVGKEITIAFLPPIPVEVSESEGEGETANADGDGEPEQNGEENTESPSLTGIPRGNESIVLLLPIANASRAQQVLENAPTPQSGAWTTREYKGVEIKENPGTDSDLYAVTVLDGKFLAVANSRYGIDRTIDTYKGALSLADLPNAGKIWQKLEGDRAFARVFVNIPVASAVASLNRQNSRIDEIAKLQPNQGFAATATIENDGIAFDSAMWRRPKSERTYSVENKAKMMADRLPAAMSIAIVGSNLQGLWNDYVAEIDVNPIAVINPQWLQTAIKTTTNLDLEQDLLSWMAGEFALAMIPPAEDNQSTFPASVVLMVQASDVRAGEETLAKLDERMQDEYQFKLSRETIGDRELVTWQSPQGSLTVTRGWLDGNVAFLTVGAPAVDRIVPKPETSLRTNTLFQTTVPAQPTPSNGYVFIDVENLLALNAPKLRLPTQQGAFLDAIRAIGLRMAVENDRTLRHHLFVRLKQAGEALPLPPAQPDRPPSSESGSPTTPTPENNN